MAFTISNWTCISSSLNQGQESVIPFGGSSTTENAPNIFIYGSPTDTASTIGGSNYFLGQYASLSVGDWIMGFGTDLGFIYQVTASTSTSVTVDSVSFTGSSPNIIAQVSANIANGAGASSAVSVPGMTTSSVVLADVISSSNGISLTTINRGTGSFTVTSADPGASLIISYVVFLTPQ